MNLLQSIILGFIFHCFGFSFFSLQSLQPIMLKSVFHPAYFFILVADLVI